MNDFIGVKIALFFEDQLVVIQRDNKPGLRFANMWDFAGGAREANESPEACVIREVQEELGITLEPTQIIWQKTYPAMHDASLTAYFMVARITPEQYHGIVFGDEGQGWNLISVQDLLADDTVIDNLKGRLQDYLQAHSKGAAGDE